MIYLKTGVEACVYFAAKPVQTLSIFASIFACACRLKRIGGFIGGFEDRNVFPPSSIALAPRAVASGGIVRAAPSNALMGKQ